MGVASRAAHEQSAGRTTVACATFPQSIGAVFGIDLNDGTRGVLKPRAIGGLRLGASQPGSKGF